MSRKHLTVDDREVIAQMRQQGHTQEQIAWRIGTHQATISRELRRNRCSTGYRPVRAHRLAVGRRREALARRPRKMDREDLRKYVGFHLRRYWSPEQIAGRWARRRRAVTITHETIYAWIWQGKRQGRSWHKYLRQSHRKNKRRSRGCADKRGKIPDRTFIEQRPAEAQTKRRFGHWEGDTLVGKNRHGAVVTHVERKSQYLVMAPLPVRDHRKLVKAAQTAFARHDRRQMLPRKTTTLDNGQEFWSHKKLGQALGVSVYFARPHHPWQRGLNEQVNGLIRQFLPKGSELKKVRTSTLVRIENLLNNRPRKTLGYRTPIEVLRRHQIYASQI